MTARREDSPLGPVWRVTGADGRSRLHPLVSGALRHLRQLLAHRALAGDGAIVIMDNLSSHKGPKARKMIEDAGAQLLFPPPCSPDFNAIERAFAKLKARLRKVAKKTLNGFWQTIGRISRTFSPQECKNYFNAAGYIAT